MNNIKYALARFSVFAVLAVFGCGGEMDDLLCVTCDTYRMTYCLYNNSGHYSCEYMNVGQCNGTNYGKDNTCGNYGMLPSSELPRCGNKEYDPATQFCQSGTNSVEDLCGSATYTAVQSCQGNIVMDKCGEDWYNPATEFCQSGSNEVKLLCNGKTYTVAQFCQEGTNDVKELCGGKPYTVEQSCKRDVIMEKCGDGWYNPATEFCQDGVAVGKCGSEEYNPATHFCQEGNEVKELCNGEAYTAEQYCEEGVVMEKCGSLWYNPATHFCQSPDVVKPFCGGETYTAEQSCEEGVVMEKCGSLWYNPATHFCQNPNVVKPLCNGETYKAEQSCEEGVVMGKCGSLWYNPATHFCQSPNVVKPLCNGKTYTAIQFCYNSIKIGDFCGINPQAYDTDLYKCDPSINPNGIFLKTEITDDRDGKTYNAVLMGTQVWMAENLNYETDGAKCYGEGNKIWIWQYNSSRESPPLSTAEIQANCDTYGRLYNWTQAMDLDTSYNTTLFNALPNYKGACPTGWHLPSRAEWVTLINFSGGRSKLQAKYLWVKSILQYSTDDYGFAALPGGILNWSGYYEVGEMAYWWTASEFDAAEAYDRELSGSYNVNKIFSLSVRCLQDLQD